MARLPRAHALEEATVLLERGVTASSPFAVARLVRKHAEHTDLVERRLDPIERSVDGARRRMEIENDRCARFRRRRRADQSRRVDEVVVERLVERPPDPLQCVRERLRRRWRRRHARRQREIEMRVRDDERGHDEAARRVQARRVRRHLAADLRNGRSLDEDVGLTHACGVELDERAPRDHDALRRLLRRGILDARRGRAQRGFRGEHRTHRVSHGSLSRP